MNHKNNYQEPPNLGEEQKTAMQVITNQQLATQTTGHSIENAKSMFHLAGELSRFISEQKLALPIQGKQYVQVEGWQFAGAMLGLTAYPLTSEDISADGEIRFRATAEVVRIADGKRISFATMSCSNKEPGKKGFQPFAVESMAQTRAVSKAYRIYLSWLIKAAGFEATPYEEMSAMDEEQQGTVMMSDKQYVEITKLCNHDLIQPTDFNDEMKNKIRSKDLTEKEARQLIKDLNKLITDRDF